MQKHAKALNLSLGKIEESIVQNSLNELLEANGVKNGRVRITVFDNASSEIWGAENQKSQSPIVLIISADFRETNLRKLKLGLSPFTVNTNSPIVGLKTCNYLENILALENAKKTGFDEAIRVNENGKIVSAAMANVFWTKNERLLTSSLETGALEGTTREYVIKTAKKLGIDCEANVFGLSSLEHADEIFLTSSGLGIAESVFVRNKTLAKRSGSSVVALLKKTFERDIACED